MHDIVSMNWTVAQLNIQIPQGSAATIWGEVVEFIAASFAIYLRMQ